MQIRLLKIDHFRGIQQLEWRPDPGLNLLIGPSNSGKTTLLNAISLLLFSGRQTQLTEFDYFNRNYAQPFHITAWLGGADLLARVADLPLAPLWGWNNDEPTHEAQDDPLICLRLTGTTELEPLYELLYPDNSAIDEPRSEEIGNHRRRRFSIVDLDEGADSRLDFRLNPYSVIGRHFVSDELRAALVPAFRAGNEHLLLSEKSKEQIIKFSTILSRNGIVESAAVNLLPPSRGNPNYLLGLVDTNTGDQPLPLQLLGSGTARLALLSLLLGLSDKSETETNFVADEIERGLEPHRQRQVLRLLRENVGTTGQAFVSTHSSSVLNAIDSDTIWRMDRSAPSMALTPLRLHQEASVIQSIIRRNIDQFFFPFICVCEGATERGFISHLFTRLLKKEPDDIGFFLVDAGGYGNAIRLTHRLLKMNYRLFLFSDGDLVSSSELKKERANNRDLDALYCEPAAKLATRACCWSDACIEDVVISALGPVALLSILREASALHEVPSSSITARLAKVGDVIPDDITEADLDARVEREPELFVPALRTLLLRQFPYDGVKGWFKSSAGGELLGRYFVDRCCLPFENDARFAAFSEQFSGFWAALEQDVATHLPYQIGEPKTFHNRLNALPNE